MIARVAMWEPMPDEDRQWVIDAAKTVAGVRDAYHLVDPDTGNGLSIAFLAIGWLTLHPPRGHFGRCRCSRADLTRRI